MSGRKSTYNSSQNILDIAGLEILADLPNEYDRYFKVKTLADSTNCRHCCAGASELTRCGVHKQCYYDLPLRGQRVVIEIQRQRWKCKACGKSFYESLSWVDDKRRITRRLKLYVEKWASKRTFADVASEVGMAENTVRNILDSHIEEKLESLNFIIPQIIGLDAINICGQLRLVVSNLEQGTVINILADSKKNTVISYLKSGGFRGKVKYVAMDFNISFRNAVHLCLPEAEIIMDRFHVLQRANSALNKIRTNLRKGLTVNQRRKLKHDHSLLQTRGEKLELEDQEKLRSWFITYPLLGEAYWLKEELYAIFELKDPGEANRRYLHWKERISPGTRPAYQDLMNDIDYWKDEICNAIKHPDKSNAGTESMNNVIRFTNRMGRGYSFTRLRGKILLDQNLYKHKLPRFNKKAFRTSSEPQYMNILCFLAANAAPGPRSYGVDINKLCQLMENGTFWEDHQ